MLSNGALSTVRRIRNRTLQLPRPIPRTLLEAENVATFAVAGAVAVVEVPGEEALPVALLPVAVIRRQTVIRQSLLVNPSTPPPRSTARLLSRRVPLRPLRPMRPPPSHRALALLPWTALHLQSLHPHGLQPLLQPGEVIPLSSMVL